MIDSSDDKALVRFENVQKHFVIREPGRLFLHHRVVRAVDGVSISLLPHQTFSIVGESGCGKSTVARLALRLEEPTAGRILFNGTDLRHMNHKQLMHYRSSVQAVFQDPGSSLDPRMRVWEIIAEPLIVNRQGRVSNVRRRVDELLDAVGLDRAAGNSFPHEFSGGQRQRIAVARALTVRPQLIVLDEPVSSLDVSIRAQIMNLLKDIQDQYRIAYLLIAHNLATVQYLSQDVVAMYLGQIVERATSEEIFAEPLHPYTKALVAAASFNHPDEPNPLVLKEDVPSPIDVPSGCRFHTRCPFAFDRCTHEVPELQRVRSGREVACHLYT